MRFATPKFVLAAAMCVGLAGCLEWKVARGPVPSATADALERRAGEPIRVELKSGVVVVISGAVVRQDSVAGMLVPALRGASAAPATYALSDVRRVEYKAVLVGPYVAYYARMILITSVVTVLLIVGWCMTTNCIG